MDERRTTPSKGSQKSVAVGSKQSVSVRQKKGTSVATKRSEAARARRARTQRPAREQQVTPVRAVAPKQAQLSLALLSPHRFPVSLEQLMVSTARIGGVAFVILGALGVLFYMAPLFTSSHISQSAQVVSGSLQGTSTASTQTSSGLTTTVQSSITVSQTPPLKGVVTVSVAAPRARKVDLYLFEQSWQNKSFLGSAKQTSIDTWEYQWDTQNIQSGLDYRITAYVHEQSTTSGPDYTLQLGYMRVDNGGLIATTTAHTAASTSIDQTPPVTLQSPAVLKGLSDVIVKVLDATSVSLSVEHVVSGSRNLLYNAKEVQPDTWLVSWPTASFSNGDYRVRARIRNQYGTYMDGTITVAVQNGAATASTATTSSSTMASAPTPPVALPIIRLKAGDGSVFSETEPVEIAVQNGPVSQVYLYVRDSVSTFPRFIGVATRRTEAEWYFNWFTGNTPNGRYLLFALAATPQGQVQSQLVSITVDNVVAMHTTPAQQHVSEDIVETSQAIVAEAALPLPEPVPAGKPDVADEETLPSPGARTLFTAHQSEFEPEFARLSSALRSQDQVLRERVVTRIDDLVTQILEQEASPEVVKVAFRTLVDGKIAEYTAQVSRVDALIAERQRADLLQDTDHDTISDFDEVTLFNTDPLVADTDNDGFVDGAEILAGYDPLSDARETLLTYESPKEAGVYRADILSVDTIAAAAVLTASSTPSGAGILLRGKALPNSFVTLYLYSTPIIVTIRTDVEGAWEYRFEQELEDGAHNVYVGITDNAGRVVAKSQPRTFIKEAEAITPVEAAALDTVVIEPQESSLVSSYVLYAIASVSVVAIGLVLILLGLHLDTRRRVPVIDDASAI